MLKAPSFGSSFVHASVPGSVTVLAWYSDAEAVCPASSRTVIVITLPGLFVGPLVIGKITEPLAGPVAMSSPSSRRSPSTASGLAV